MNTTTTNTKQTAKRKTTKKNIDNRGSLFGGLVAE